MALFCADRGHMRVLHLVTVMNADLLVLFNCQVTVFQQEHYLENFVQSTFDALPSESLTGEFPNAHFQSPAEV